MTDAERKYEQLGRAVMARFARFEFGHDLDGGWIQDAAVKLGIIEGDASVDELDRLYVFAKGCEP